MKITSLKKKAPSIGLKNRSPFFIKSNRKDSYLQNVHKSQNRHFFSPFGVDSNSGMIQTKLTVRKPGDKYEQEADAMANQVMRMNDPLIERQSIESGEDEMAMPKREPWTIQMKCDECEKEEESLHRKSLAGNISPVVQREEKSGGQINDRVETSLKASKNGGESLRDDTRHWMESRFGTDFSHVKVHTDSHAVQMSRELNAQAFTYGNNIYFNRGKFAPDTPAGKHLLAHELTHTLQQQGIIQRQPEQEQDVAVDKPLLPGYTQCDFLNERISFEAQYALYHLYKRGDRDRQTSLSILGAVKSTMMQGIYKEDQGKPALMARRHGTFWWQLIPKGLGAIVFEAEEPPMMVFKKNIANDRAVLGDALRNAWDASSLGEKAVIIPPPSLQPCPIVIDPVTIEVEPEKECPPGTIFDPENDLCILDLPGIVKTECTDAEMENEFQRQEDSCANLKMAIDLLCKGPVTSPCDLIGSGGKIPGIPKSALPGLKNLCKTLGLSNAVCDESRADFYERCIVSSIEGGKDSMSCYPGSKGKILEKYRRWPGREK